MTPQRAAELLDDEMREVAMVDVTLHAVNGWDESKWTTRQTTVYLAAIAEAHGRFHPDSEVSS